MKWAVFMSLAGALALVALSFSWRTGAWKPAPSADPAAPLVLMVDDLHDRPSHFTGEIEVLGIVGGNEPGQQLFGLIDRREVAECGGIACARFVLPVKWEGKFPEPGDAVVVRGRIRETGEGPALVASEVVRQ